MKRMLLALATLAALWSAACSSGSSNTTPPPPVGKYSNSSLNGQYAFVTSGEVFTPGAITATPLSRTGSFTADGQGHITGGIEDVNSAGSPTNAIPITGGSYSVAADGRGTLTLLFAQSSITFGIVLTSTNDGLMIDETSTSTQASTGSGNFIKQNSGSFTITAISGSYVFDFSGLDANQGPISTVGQFAVSGGPITNGVEDVNDNAVLTTAATVSGNFAADGNNVPTLTGFGRGIALINGSQYAFYIVDGTRVRLVSISGGMLTGDAVAQSSNVPANVSSLNSGFAFVVAGASGTGGLTRVGRFTASGSSVTNVLVDTNDSGKFTPTNTVSSPSISLDPANPGRGIVTFHDTNLQLAFRFVFYLSSAIGGVIQETTPTPQGFAAVVADGSIAAQSGSPFTASNISGTYAFNWSGLSFQQGGQFIDEEDLVAQADISNLALTGAADIFQFTNGVPVPNLVVGGSITMNGDGTGGDAKRSTMSVKLTGASPISFVVYFVNPQLAFFANNTAQSPTRIVAGVIKAQQ